jgi:hypothetical protein
MVMHVALTYAVGKLLNMPAQILPGYLFHGSEWRQGPLVRDAGHPGVQWNQYDGSD